MISGVTNFILEKRKEYLAARVAARLVRDELYITTIWIEDLLSAENIREEQFNKIKARTSTDSWPNQRTHLAAALNYKEFANASMAVEAVNNFKYWLDSKHAVSNLESKDRSFLTNNLENLRPGLEALKEVAK